MAHTAVLDVDALPTRNGPTSLDAAHALAVAPTLPARWLPRPRPLRALHAAASRRIVLVRGPAGYGKSALVAHWARSTGRPIAWVCFDRSDDHPDRVASLVAAAIRRVAPSATPDTRGNSDTDAVTGLCDAIERAGVHALVLDDVDVLSDAALDTVRRLASSMPACARTIAIARGALSHLPIARWRWRGDLADLEAEALAFTRDETARYLRDAWGWPADAATVDRVWTRTVGWPAALHVIASRASRTGGDVLDVDTDRLGEFTAAVLDREEPDDVAWLLRCSVLDALDPDTCADIAEGDAAERLERLASRGLVVPSPDGGYCHLPLLRDMLRRELRTRFPVESGRLWHGVVQSQAERGDPVGAVATAREHGRDALAVGVLETHRNAIAASDGGATLQRLAASFDRDPIAARPALVATLVDLAALSRDIPRLTGLLDALAQPHDEPTAAAAMHAEATLARLAGVGRHGVGTMSAEEGSATLDHLRGVEAGWDGDHARAEKLLRRALADAARRGDPVRQLVVLGDLAWECARAGRVPVAELLARRAVALARRLRFDRPPLVVQLAQAWIALDRGRRDRADQLVRHVAQVNAARRDPTVAFEVVMTRLRVDDDPRATHRALRALDELAHHGECGGALMHRLARANATLRLRSGGTTRAAEHMLTVDDDERIRPAGRLLLARLLLREGHLARARAQAAAVTPQASGPRLAVAAALVEAAAARAAGDRRAALVAIRRARVTAIAHSMAPAAGRVPPIRPVRDPASRGGARPLAPTARAASPTLRTDDRPPVEHLTQRELEALQLLPSGLSYKGIALELAVSLNTVKSHLKSVYRKLGARSRYEALNRAGQLGLLSTSVTTPASAGAAPSVDGADATTAPEHRRSVTPLASHGAQQIEQLARPVLAHDRIGGGGHLVLGGEYRDRGTRAGRPGELTAPQDVG